MSLIDQCFTASFHLTSELESVTSVHFCEFKLISALFLVLGFNNFNCCLTKKKPSAKIHPPNHLRSKCITVQMYNRNSTPLICALRLLVLVFEQNEFVNVLIPAAVEFHEGGE